MSVLNNYPSLSRLLNAGFIRRADGEYILTRVLAGPLRGQWTTPPSTWSEALIHPKVLNNAAKWEVPASRALSMMIIRAKAAKAYNAMWAESRPVVWLKMCEDILNDSPNYLVTTAFGTNQNYRIEDVMIGKTIEVNDIKCMYSRHILKHVCSRNIRLREIKARSAK